MYKCDFCGSSFGDRICYFCDKSCCTNCMIDDRTRCKECYIKKRKLGVKKLLKRNKMVLGFAAFLWAWAVFPGPFIPDLDPTYYVITLVAALLILIPLCLALFFWSLSPPKSDLRKRD